MQTTNAETTLVWRDGIPVLIGKPLPRVDWDRLVEDEREERIRRLGQELADVVSAP